MDNIAKLVLGVVGMIGLLVLMIPQGNPLADKGTTEPAAVVAPDPIPNEAPPNEPETVTTVNAPIQDISAFGQPMLDPTPPGQKQSQEPVQPQQMANEGNGVNPETVAPYPANPSLGAPAYDNQGGYQVGPIPTGG